LGRIRDEEAKKLEQYRLEKQAHIVELEIEKRQRDSQAKQEIIDRFRDELVWVDSTTRRDIEQSYIGWDLLPPTICFILAMVDSNERVTLLLFWMGVLMLAIHIYSTRSAKNSAITLRRKRGLTEL
jgi:hypothetical protein